MPAPTHPILSIVADRALAGGALAPAIEAAFSGGADWLQIRDRSLEDEELLDFARAARAAALRGASTSGRRGAMAAGRRVRVIINRRCDIALAMDADGVHLGFDGLAPGDVRSLVGDQLVGVSAHSVDELRAAAAAGADYAHLAPIWPPISKKSTRPALGDAALRAATSCGIAIIAQGGIDAERCGDAIEAGAAGVAVTGAVLQAADPGAAALRLRQALDRARAT